MRLALRTFALWLTLAAVFGAAVTLVARAHGTAPHALEDALLSWFAARGREPLLGVARVLTMLGTAVGYLPLSGAAFVLVLPHSRRLAAYFATIVAGAGGHYVLLNRGLFSRERPALLPAGTFEGSSFPSGHALVTIALVVALLVVVAELRPRWLASAVLAGLAFVAAVAATRLYLLAHYPSDILAGWVLGLAWSLGVTWLWREQLSESASRHRTRPERSAISSPWRAAARSAERR
jgi:undecaprenyl-diphosphatase